MAGKQDSSVNPKGIRFRFFVRGDDIRPRAVRGSREGAVIVTNTELKQADTVLAYPYVDETTALPAVLVASVIQVPERPEEGYRVRWLRCLGHHGVEPIQELLKTYLRFPVDSLPSVTLEVANSSLVAFDFVRQVYFVPRRRSDSQATVEGASTEDGPTSHTSVERRRPEFTSSTSYSSGTRPKEPTGVVGIRRAAGQVTLLPQPPVAGQSKQPSSTTAPVHLGSKETLSTPQPEEAPGPQFRTLAEYQESKRRPDDTPSESGRMLSRERARIPVKLPVTFLVGRKKVDATITSLGLNQAFMATEHAFTADEARVEVTLPIPGQRTPVSVTLVCSVVSSESGEQLGYPGVDMTIVGVDQRQKPGIFERYIKALYYEMTRR